MNHYMLGSVVPYGTVYVAFTLFARPPRTAFMSRYRIFPPTTHLMINVALGPYIIASCSDVLRASSTTSWRLLDHFKSSNGSAVTHYQRWISVLYRLPSSTQDRYYTSSLSLPYPFSNLPNINMWYKQALGQQPLKKHQQRCWCRKALNCVNQTLL